MAEESDLFKELHKYRKSLEEEFDAIKSDDSTALAEKVRARLASKLLSFADTVIELSEDSESEGTRLSAAKFGLQFVLGPTDGKAGKKSALDELLDKIMAGEEDEPVQP